MLVRLSTPALRRTSWRAFAARLVLGGLATVVTGLAGAMAGPSVGGLFLALPAIFCASATLIESTERHHKHVVGMHGEQRGKMAAALDAAGTALGSIGMLAFAVVFAAVVRTQVAMAFVAATLAWSLIAVAAWYCRRSVRRIRLHAGMFSRAADQS